MTTIVIVGVFGALGWGAHWLWERRRSIKQFIDERFPESV